MSRAGPTGQAARTSKARQMTTAADSTVGTAVRAAVGTTVETAWEWQWPKLAGRRSLQRSAQAPRRRERRESQRTQGVPDAETAARRCSQSPAPTASRGYARAHLLGAAPRPRHGREREDHSARGRRLERVLQSARRRWWLRRGCSHWQLRYSRAHQQTHPKSLRRRRRRGHLAHSAAKARAKPRGSTLRASRSP